MTCSTYLKYHSASCSASARYLIRSREEQNRLAGSTRWQACRRAKVHVLTPTSSKHLTMVQLRDELVLATRYAIIYTEKRIQYAQWPGLCSVNSSLYPKGILPLAFHSAFINAMTSSRLRQRHLLTQRQLQLELIAQLAFCCLPLPGSLLQEVYPTGKYFLI